jgi:MIP family channel proteins
MYMAKIFVAELFGTFTLVLVGAGAVAIGEANLVGVALAHGLVLLVMVYTYGWISGTHINPAVTLGAAISGALSWSKAVIYWISQFIGGTIAALVLAYFLGGTSSGLGATLPRPGVSNIQAVVIEAVLTFFLVTTVLHTAVAGKGGALAGVAIGFTLAAAILIGGPLTGASLNPARSFGPMLLTGNMSQFWIYLIGPSLGGALAAGLFWYLRPSESDSNPA